MMAAAAVLGGCALPLPAKLASWALDGISYMATKKSVTDHGLSMVVGKDCALLRMVTRKGEVCTDNAARETAVAAAKNPQKQPATAEGAAEEAATDALARELAEFDTAAGGEAPSEAASRRASREDDPVSTLALPEDAQLIRLWQGDAVAEPAPRDHQPSMIAATDPSATDPSGGDRPARVPLGASVQTAAILPEGAAIVSLWEGRAVGTGDETEIAEWAGEPETGLPTAVLGRLARPEPAADAAKSARVATEAASIPAAMSETGLEIAELPGKLAPNAWEKVEKTPMASTIAAAERSEDKANSFAIPARLAGPEPSPGLGLDLGRGLDVGPAGLAVTASRPGAVLNLFRDDAPPSLARRPDWLVGGDARGLGWLRVPDPGASGLWGPALLASRYLREGRTGGVRERSPPLGTPPAGGPRLAHGGRAPPS